MTFGESDTNDESFQARAPGLSPIGRCPARSPNVYYESGCDSVFGNLMPELRLARPSLWSSHQWYLSERGFIYFFV